MNLRCLVCSPDKNTAAPICHVLAELGVEADQCLDAATAASRIAGEDLQIVIVDFDQQAEAETLLKAARGRKGNERPLTLAIVRDDQLFPKALQAGANSILRKPILVSQVKDTLQTARSLLKARQSSPMTMAAAAPANPPAFSVEPPANDAHLRAGEFLQSSSSGPASQIDMESEIKKSIEDSVAANVNPLKDLEPTASAVSQEVPVSPAESGEPRGLQWYLKNRGVASPYVLSHAEAQVPAPAPEKPELLAFDKPPARQVSKPPVAEKSEPPAATSAQVTAGEERAEAELFDYISKGGGESTEKGSGSGFRLGKGPILFAAALAAIAIVAAPQAPWHSQIRGAWSHGRVMIHTWLNPQPVAPPQAAPTHEDFGRAGDEYKLPVAETIPDATTDPSQIRVTPVIDPTAKKPNPAANVDPNVNPADPGNAGSPTQPAPVPNAPAQPSTASSQVNPPVGNSTVAPTTTEPPSTSVVATAVPTAPIKVTPLTAEPSRTEPPTAALPSSPVAAQPQPARNPQPRPASANTNPHIPSSLQSQMASMTPEASGNKAPETALPSIEPVDVPEAAERNLLNGQPAIAYPASAKGQQGTVVLQVLIARDGTVQDAKFLQGALAFARAAIDGVKQWTFKPYSMNGRPVSVQTRLTLTFRPGQ